MMRPEGNTTVAHARDIIRYNAFQADQVGEGDISIALNFVLDLLDQVVEDYFTEDADASRIESKYNSRERVCVFGGPGAGKSRCGLSVARYTTGKVWIIDNDDAYERLLETEYEDVMERDNYEIRNVPRSDFDAAVDALKEFRAKAAKGDWIIFDMLGDTWPAVQGWFTDQMFGKDIDAYFLEVRSMRSTTRQGKGGADKVLSPFEGMMDWPVINKVYTKRIAEQCVNMPCHFMAMAGAQPVQDSDDKQIRQTYLGLGVRPQGQKAMSHWFHSVFFLNKPRTGDWQITTAKDRGRGEFDGAPFMDFSRDYLMRMAAWRPVQA